MKGTFYQVLMRDKIPHIYVEGIIGDDADYKGFRNALEKVIDGGHKRMKLLVNSGGGSMVHGFAYYDLLKASTMIIEVEVVGMAASMGAILAQVASPGMLGIHKNASFMTHKAQVGAYGEADHMRSQADFAEKLEKRAVAIVKQRTGQSDEVIAEWFKPGVMKWFDADEAVTAGLADYIIENDVVAKKPTAFKQEADAMAFYNSIKTPFKSEINMKKTILVLNTYKVQHTLTDESTDEQVSAVVDAALKAKDARIAELERLVENAAKDKATALVEAAIKDGKVKAESKDKYVAMAAKDYDAVKELFDGLQGRIDPKQVIITGTPAAGAAPAAPVKKFSEHTEKELRDMKLNNFEQFKALFKAQYEADYTAE